MKKRLIVTVLLLLGCVATLVPAQNGNNLFQQALARERVDGDFEGAIQIYQRIVREFPTDRQLVARAQMQLGSCYEQLGQSQARNYYESVIKAYKDQPDMAAIVREAQTRLQGPVIQASDARREIQMPFTRDPTSFAISPDGRKLVYEATTAGKSRLWLYDLTTGEHTPIRGAELQGSNPRPFWSPDSQSIAFFAGQKLKRIPATGGVAQDLADAGSMYSSGGSWSKDGVIIFSDHGPLYRTSEHGIERVQITTIAANETHRFPQFLPDGNHFLFYKETGGTAVLRMGSLADPTLQSPVPVPPISGAVMVQDRLLFVDRQGGLASGGPLFAQSLNLQNLRLTGNPQPLAERVGLAPMVPGLAAFSVSETGRIAYRSDFSSERRLVWRDRSGKLIGDVGRVDSAFPAAFRISPNGKTIAFHLPVSHGLGSYWLIDAAGGEPQPLNLATFGLVWSPGGDEIAAAGIGIPNRPAGLFRQLVNNRTGIRMISPSTDVFPEDWSQNGFLLYSRSLDVTSVDLMAIPVNGGEPISVAETSANESGGRWSPDGKWIAYVSEEKNGSPEIFLQSFPGSRDARKQVSVSGGLSPHWGRGGKELYYLSLDYHLMAAEVTFAADGESVALKAPRPLFPEALPMGSEFDVTADGERFLVSTPVAEATPIIVLSNWTPAK